MKTKNNSKSVEKHLSQNVYSLVLTYKQYSRTHKHSFIFSFTEDRSLVKEVNRLISYSCDRLPRIYPWMKDDIELCAYEVEMISPIRYKIAPATVSCSALLREQIYVTPYDAHAVDFSFCVAGDTDSDHNDDIPF